MSLRLIASLFIDTSEVAPQSTSALIFRPTRWKQVLNRPPEPKASPQPTNCTCMNIPQSRRRPVHRPAIESAPHNLLQPEPIASVTGITRGAAASTCSYSLQPLVIPAYFLPCRMMVEDPAITVAETAASG